MRVSNENVAACSASAVVGLELREHQLLPEVGGDGVADFASWLHFSALAAGHFRVCVDRNPQYGG